MLLKENGKTKAVLIFINQIVKNCLVTKIKKIHILLKIKIYIYLSLIVSAKYFFVWFHYRCSFFIAGM